MPFYFDESIHERGDFILGAYVFGPDPTNDGNAALAAVGLDPDRDEFKSSAKMAEHPEQQVLRGELHKILHMTYRYAVVVVPHQERRSLGAEALLGLRKICEANGLTQGREPAYFDKGLFSRDYSLVCGAPWRSQSGLGLHTTVTFTRNKTLATSKVCSWRIWSRTRAPRCCWTHWAYFQRL